MRHLICFLCLFASALCASGAEQRLRDGDTFRLAIGGPPRIYTSDFELEYTIDGGVVTIPMLGAIRAVDITQRQLAADIEKRLKDLKIFTNPNVIISLQRQQATVVVGGAVRNPNRHQWVQDMTLSQIIAAAGGPADFAKDKVTIVRNGKKTEFSRRAIKKDPSLDPQIHINDYIEVEGDF